MHQTIECNPFRTAAVRPGAVSLHDRWAAESLAEKFLQDRSGQIVGPHGSGKSTLVAHLVKRLSGKFQRTVHLQPVKPSDHDWLSSLRHRQRTGRWVQRETGKLLADSPQRSLVIVDGADQLPLVAFWTFYWQMRRLDIACLLTCHKARVRVPVLYRTLISPKLIVDLTLQRICRSSPVVQAIVQQELSRGNLPAVTNLRDYWFHLYDIVQPHLQPLPAQRRAPHNVEQCDER